MSSKRRLRRRACEGKIRHDKHAHAFRHMLHLINTGKANGYMNVYHCQFCKGYHVGRPPAKAMAAGR